MAATPGAKSRGMKFAEEQLQRHGWTEGKGLGRRESGISEAIKVKVKCDSAGVGHNSAEQFTFHWWDHVFNKTASSISVEPHQDGVQVKKVTDDDSAVTNKKPRKALTNRDMLYGRFIKSATLLSGGEKPVEKESSSSSSDSSEDEDEKLDLSSATKLTDDDLVKICGGRTAHKGARHGLTMSAKLLRVEEQERAFLEKYGKKEPSGESARPSRGLSSDTKAETGRKKEKSRPVITNEDISSNTTQPKKKKRKTVKDEALEEDGTNGYEEHVPWKEEDTMISKRNVDSEDFLDVLSGEASSNKTVEEDPARGLSHGQLLDLKYSKKKKKKVAGEEVKEAEDPEDHARGIQEDIRSSKKKKRKVAGEGVKEEAEDPEDHARGIQEDVRSSKKKKKKVKKDEGNEELLNGHQEWPPTEDLRLSKKKKKRRKVKEEEKVEGREELLNGHQDWAPSELSEKKKKSRRDLEEKVEEELDESTEEHVQSTKKLKKVEEVDEQTSMEEERCQTIKRKKSKNKYRDSPTPEEEAGQAVEGAEHRSKSKKKRKE